MTKAEEPSEEEEILEIRIDPEQHPYLVDDTEYLELAELEDGWDADTRPPAGLGAGAGEGAGDVEHLKKSLESLAAQISAAKGQIHARAAATRAQLVPVARHDDQENEPPAVPQTMTTTPPQRPPPQSAARKRGSAGRSSGGDAGGSAMTLMEGGGSLLGELERLAGLCVHGLLTQGEFTAAKQALIKAAARPRRAAPRGAARGEASGDVGDSLVLNRGFGEFSVLNPARNATPATPAAGGAALDGTVPIFDINRFASSAARWLQRRQQRLPMLVHTPGANYDTRYKLHAFSGYEIATVRSRLFPRAGLAGLAWRRAALRQTPTAAGGGVQVKAAPAFSMGKKSRLDSFLGPISDAPGPGALPPRRPCRAPRARRARR